MRAALGLGALIALIALTACGRIGFGELDDASVAAASDAVLADASACTATAEICDGIDNDCDGLVDEGCPCTPYQEGLTRLINRGIVSLGDGWAMSSGSRYVRIDDAGTIVVDVDIGDSFTASNDPTQTLAWNGTDLGFFDASTGAFAFLAPDGTNLRHGPAFAQPMTAGILRWNGASWDAAVSPDGGPVSFYRMDIAGNPLTIPIVTATDDIVLPMSLFAIDGQSALFWYTQATEEVAGLVAIAAPPAALVPQTLPGATLGIFPAASSDGRRALIPWGTQAFELDGLTVSTLAAAFQSADSVAWTGDGWDVGDLGAKNANPLAVLDLHVDPTLDVTTDNTLISEAWTSSIGYAQPAVIADARRTLIVWAYQIDSGGPQTSVTQTCH